MKISFHGAADSVTGSRHRVDIADARLLLDCGLFQGYKVLRERNWAPPPPALLAADAVVLSHAHLDHSGWLPVLVKHGWKGPVYASAATCDLAQVLLLDAAHLNEEDARRANRYGYSRHAKALPLYTKAQAQRALALLRPLRAGQAAKVGGQGGATVRLSPVGHLLGACAVHVEGGGESLLFSGDVGRSDDLLMPPPQPAPGADVLLVESTYGNRLHPKQDVAERLGAIVRDTIGRGGSVLLPSFAVGRAQALLLALQRLKTAGEIPVNLPVFLDSPMAIAATELYRRHAKLLRIPAREARALMDSVHAVETAQQSMRLARQRYPAVIISASGMATGGRVLHHLKHMAPDPRHHIVFAGFQVGGSRGARIVAGEPEVKIHGEYVPVRATVSQLEGFSGHADADGLLAWLRTMPAAPRQTFVVHGEPDAADTLRHRIQDELHWRVRVPQHGETVNA
jgi:metallo-beta-lactamase family protein